MSSTAPTRLGIKPGHPEQNEFELGVSPETARALIEELEHEGFTASQVFKFSTHDVSNLLEYTVHVGTAGLVAYERLASAISKWTHRYDGDSIEFYDNGQLKSATGLAP